MRTMKLAMVLVIATVCLFSGLSDLRSSSRRKAWPTVPGQLLAREVVPVNPDSKTSLFRAAPRYRYTVGEQELVGSELYSRPNQVGGRGAMQRQVDLLPEAPLVHYDPQHPEQAFLVPSESPLAMVTLSIGLAALALGIGMLVARLLWG